MAYTNLCGYYYSSRWAVTAGHFCALCCSITKCMQDHSKEAILSNSMILIVVAKFPALFCCRFGQSSKFDVTATEELVDVQLQCRSTLPVHTGTDVHVALRRRFRSVSTSTPHGHTVHTTHHAGRSSLLGDCCSSVECSSVVCSFCATAAAVPPRPQDGTACFSHRTLHRSVQLCNRL